ncbi:MAG: rod shape-determining protein [Proteobacteria bacterium]|nr:rod shape-determining protein [Pseudomonadota bacterium]
MFERISRVFSNDIAIDLGTANTLVFVAGKGIVHQEPSVVAVQTNPRGETRVLAVGADAKLMLGKTPGTIQAIRPMKDGVIANLDVTSDMVRYFIKKVQKSSSLLKFRPRVIVGVPSGITQVEGRAHREAVESAGAREVFLVEEPMAAAIGAGLPVMEANGNMIIDVGGGTTEVAVISLGGVVYSNSTKVGGDIMDDTIIQYIKKRYNLLIGERTAEQIKIKIGSAYPGEDNLTMDVKGRDLLNGIPKTLILSNDEIRESLADVCDQIVMVTKNALEDTDPELAADIIDKGIVLAGGGSLLKGMDILLRERTGLPIIYAEDPLSCVALGVGQMLDNIDLLKSVAVL